MRKFSRRWVPHFLSPAQKVAHVEASKTILRVLQDPESDDFEGIATGGEFWFRYCYPSSTVFARAIRGYPKDTANNWLFGMLNGILNDREFHSHDEIEEVITMAWNDLTFDEVQSVFRNWMNRLR
jgi:hypothetical protein